MSKAPLPILEKQNLLRDKISSTDSEFLSFYTGPHTHGMGSGNWFVVTEIKCLNKYFSFRDEDEKYHFFPPVSFSITLSRFIYSPFSIWDKDNRVYAEVGNMRCGLDNPAKVKLRLTLPEKLDFFEMLNALRGGERFHPFILEGEKDLLDRVNSEYFLSVHAYAGNEGLWKIQAGTKDIQNLDIEGMANELIDLFTIKSENFKELQPIHRSKDEKGNRLWEDQGMQPEEYYKILDQISRSLLEDASVIIEKQGLKCQKSWSVGGQIRMTKYAIREYGLMVLPMAITGIFNAVAREAAHFFKSLWPFSKKY